MMEPVLIDDDQIQRMYAVYSADRMGHFLVAFSDIEVYQRFPDARSIVCIGTVYKKGSRIEITRLKNPQYVVDGRVEIIEPAL